MCRQQVELVTCWHVDVKFQSTFPKSSALGLYLSHLLDHAYWNFTTRSPAVARDGRPYWPSRETVIPSGIGLAAVLRVGQLSWLVKLIVHWLTAYCPSTIYRATLAVINNACLLTCDTSRTNCDQHPQFIYAVIWTQVTRAYNFGRRLSRYVMQTNKHLQFI